jgi:2-amino-4-hydroxy-6-hydroxymethyldihydropteridine diphosphokinase
MVTVFLGLGSNLGESITHLNEAYHLLNPYFHNLVASNIVQSDPMYVIDQPKFYNQVLKGSTHLSARELLVLTQDIQEKIGRVKTYRNGPRTIDIDILYFGDLVLSEPDFVIPHPRIHERLFVLQPLVELDPTWVCPNSRKSAADLLSDYIQSHGDYEPLLTVS